MPTRDDEDRTDPGSRSEKSDAWVRSLSAGTLPAGGDFTFDFDAFERSEAEAARPRPEEEAPGLVLRPVEKRPVVPRNWLPPGDSVVETRPVGNMTVVTLRGRINESFRGTELGQSLRGVVVFDLSQVDRISSFGVKGWLQMMEHARFTSAYFFRCSEAVINQITMMRNFCGSGRIHSLLVPYQCPACGEEFSSVYEAVHDREVILGRSPVPVECPRCASASRMADDPWAYLSIDEHLLDSVPADLEQVLEHLTQAQRVDPIEKFVSDDETRIRINAALDPRLRLTRALTGLEGKVVFDLTPRPDIAAGGIQRLLDAIRGLDDDVTEVWIDGATKPLIEALLVDPPRRTYVSTAWVTAIAAGTGLRRPVLVEVRKKRQALLRGELAVLEGGRGPSHFEDAQVVFEAARHLVPASLPTATPTPMGAMGGMGAGTGTGRTPVPQPMSYQPHSTATPLPAPLLSTQARLQALQLQQMQQMQQMQMQMQQIERPAQRASGGLSIPIWQLMMFGAVTMALAAVAFIIVFVAVARNIIASQRGGGEEAAITSVAAPSQLGWSDGSPLPPAWVEQPVVADQAGVRAVGLARADTPEAAAEQARTAAVYQLVLHLSDRLATTDIGPALGTDPGEEFAETIAARFLDDVGAWATPQRVNQDVKREANGFTVATQYQLDAQIFDRVVDYYGQTYDFRGLVVGRRFPFHGDKASAVLVVKADTWFKDVSPGDAVLQVGRDTVLTYDEFVKSGPIAYRETPEGQAMVVIVDHDGKRSRLEFVSRSAPAPRKESKIDLLPLELEK